MQLVYLDGYLDLLVALVDEKAQKFSEGSMGRLAWDKALENIKPPHLDSDFATMRRRIEENIEISKCRRLYYGVHPDSSGDPERTELFWAEYYRAWQVVEQWFGWVDKSS